MESGGRAGSYVRERASVSERGRDCGKGADEAACPSETGDRRRSLVYGRERASVGVCDCGKGANEAACPSETGVS